MLWPPYTALLGSSFIGRVTSTYYVKKLNSINWYGQRNGHIELKLCSAIAAKVIVTDR